MNGQRLLKRNIIFNTFLGDGFFLFHQEMNGNSKKLYKNYNCNSFYQI